MQKLPKQQGHVDNFQFCLTVMVQCSIDSFQSVKLLFKNTIRVLCLLYVAICCKGQLLEHFNSYRSSITALRWFGTDRSDFSVNQQGYFVESFPGETIQIELTKELKTILENYNTIRKLLRKIKTSFETRIVKIILLLLQSINHNAVIYSTVR